MRENTSLLLRWEGQGEGENWDSLMTSFIMVESQAMVIFRVDNLKQCYLTNTTIVFMQSDSLRAKVVV